MLQNRKPDEWEVFNNPSRHPVKYYSVLKKKREFSQLIRQYDAQIFKHGYFHYCSIVPKNTNSALNNKCELFIIFWGEVPNTSFIGFRIKVSKEAFIHESNSLMLFLKKLIKPVFYLMNNNCIHVQCGKNAWELFYLLYDEYLRQYVLTIIGTQFFYHFVYSFCIQREIQLLEFLFKGSKIIRISKKSIYYKIHRKRKISLSNLIHMTINMPQSKRCIISFNSKVSLFHSNFENENYYTCSGSKIHVSKLVLKKLKRQVLDTVHDVVTNPVAPANDSEFLYPLEILDSKCAEKKSDITNKHVLFSKSLKRKLEEYDIHSGQTTSKFLKISESACPTQLNKDLWEQYTNIKPFTVKTYSGIPCLKYLVPNLYSNGKSSHINNSDSYLYNKHGDASVLSNIVTLSPVKETDLNSDHLMIEETSEIADQINLHSTTKSDCNFESYLSFKENTPDQLTHGHTSCNTQNPVSSNMKIPNSGKHEYLHSENIRRFSSEIITSNSLSSPESFNQHKINASEDLNFMTAGGKSINISKTAMLTACRFMEDVCDDENQQVLQSKSNFDSNKKRLKKLPNFDYNELCEKFVTENTHLDKTCTMPSHSIRSLKGSEIISNNLDVDLLDNKYENFKPESLDHAEDGTFSTAAGKTLTVSNTAIQAAQKLIQDVFQEESVITPSTAINKSRYKKKNSSAFRDIGFLSKRSVAEEIDVDMDKTLVEKLFEDTVFDEQELEKPFESNKDNSSVVVLEPQSNKNLPTRKQRKSLGGRRSRRFCSDAL